MTQTNLQMDKHIHRTRRYIVLRVRSLQTVTCIKVKQ